MLTDLRVENATASAFPVATRPELVDRSCRSEAEIPLQRGCGVSERTTIKWNHFLTFRRFPAATRPERHDLSSSTSLVDRSRCRELQLLSRDHEDGRATWQPSRLPRDWFRGVPERYLAGAEGREGWILARTIPLGIGAALVLGVFLLIML